MIGIHVLEVAIILSTLDVVRSFRPAYSALDVLSILAVGMIAGAVYILTVTRLEKAGMKQMQASHKPTTTEANNVE